MRKGVVVLLLAGLPLAAPAGASAHGRAATIALDYRLVLHPAVKRLPGVSVGILDGDRSLRITVERGTLVVRGDLGEPMLQLSPAGALGNRASATAVAEKLVTPGSGWKRLSSDSTFTWHEHRLAPPPYDGSRTGPVADFAIPASLNGNPVQIGGTFVRYARPTAWPWFGAAAGLAAALAIAIRMRPRLRARLIIALGSLAGLAALGTLVAFGVADAPTGNVAWAQIVLGGLLGALVCVLFWRLRGTTRVHLAGLVGVASVFVSLGWLSAFWHSVVVSALSPTATRIVLVTGLVAGAVAAVTSFVVEDTK